MHFRYKDHQGKVVVLDDVTLLAQAVREGVVTPDTPLAVGAQDNFRSADMVVAYQQVVVGLERNRLGTTPPVGDKRVPAQKSGARTAAFVMVGIATLALLFFLVRSPDARPSALSATATPSAEMRADLNRLVTEFGDSVALRQHRLETWLAEQRFSARLSGRALQTTASLHALQSAIAAFLKRVDTLQSGASVLASRLVLRADSLEGTDGVRQGLFVATGDALRDWERDLSAYAELQRANGATLDSLVAFTLERQQSFVVRDGRPVFLSRTDAARFRELVAELDNLASKEQRWAENVLARNANWMAALAPADRPAFRRSQGQRSNQ